MFLVISSFHCFGTRHYSNVLYKFECYNFSKCSFSSMRIAFYLFPLCKLKVNATGGGILITRILLIPRLPVKWTCLSSKLILARDLHKVLTCKRNKDKLGWSIKRSSKWKEKAGNNKLSSTWFVWWNMEIILRI